jgi:carboxyl-terminal processing protease
VETEKGRFGFLRASDAHEARNAKAAAPELAARTVPRATRRSCCKWTRARAAWSPPSDRYTLSGTVAEPKGLLDMYVLVNDQKVFFRTSDSPKNEPTKLKFSTDFPLKEARTP